jgi:2-polyprenyl-3-methyl-5-hydroxy-6-metoxy-1,4-benzoquinol methylase
MYKKIPPKDLQKTWHEFVSDWYQNKNINSILDIGTGWGKSKERLQKITKNVVTQDINQALMDLVDIIDLPENIAFSSDLVTAFDVIEHVPWTIRTVWIFELYRLSNRYIFITTPNGEFYDKAWCYKSEEFLSIVKHGLGCIFNNEVEFEYFLNFKNSEKEYIINVSLSEFLNNEAQGLGLGIIKNEQ